MLMLVLRYKRILLFCLVMIWLQTMWKIAKLEYTTNFNVNSTVHYDQKVKVPVSVLPVRKYRRGPRNVTMLHHPHRGARDADGKWNYIPDVTFIRRKVLAQIGNASSTQYFPLLQQKLFDEVCQIPPGHGVEGLEGYKVLRHVQLNGPNPVPELLSINPTNLTNGDDNTTTMMIPSTSTSSSPTTDVVSNNLSPARILCAVYTYEAKHDHLQAIVDTWGWRCDGFFAASTKTDDAIGAVDLPHLGKEVYGNMWQKSRSILAFMYDNYIDEYDYFHVVGDDTHLIVENLRNYLHLLEAQEGGRDVRPLYIGLPAKFSWRRVIYNIGGPGYMLNNLALRRLVVEAFPTCETEGFHIEEDLIVATCLFDILGILPIDTADAAHRQRFFDTNPNETAVFDPMGTIFEAVYDYWAMDHGWRLGINLVSSQAVAFHHLKSPVAMWRHHAIIYNSCPIGSALKRDLLLATNRSQIQN